MMWTTRPRSEGAGALSYWREGNGPPLILIHGVGLRAEAWAAIAPVLSDRFTVYAVDMPGHGASPFQSETGLGDYVSRFSALVESFDGPVRVAGHSMGAMIALELAARHPDQIVGVAALNAIYRRTPEATKAVQVRAAALRAAPKASPDATLERWFADAPSGALAAARDACQSWLAEADRDGYATAYSVFANHDGPDEAALRNLQMPALFQTGPGDMNSTPNMSRHMATLAPKAIADIVTGAAHMMPMTHPKAVATALSTVFQNHPTER